VSGSVASIAELNTARAIADRMRREYLTSVTLSQDPQYPYGLTIVDVIEAAAHPDRSPLRTIRLRELLLSQPGWGVKRTSEFLSRFVNRAGARLPASGMTIGWLLDGRVMGDRWIAFCDTWQQYAGVRAEPWTGFPMTAPPAGVLVRCADAESYASARPERRIGA
jgi:hypothetical protein